MRVRAEIDLKALGLTKREWLKFIKDQPWEEIPKPKVYDTSMRDHTQGWQRVGTVKEITGADWLSSRGWTESGVYALVYDPKAQVTNPITEANTIVLGETIQSFALRIYSHVGGLKGKHTNTKAKWEGHHLRAINEHFGTDVKQDLKNIVIWFKPHSLLDPDWQYDKQHSQRMETQCQAFYLALHGRVPPANRRDAPYSGEVLAAIKILEEQGYTVSDRALEIKEEERRLFHPLFNEVWGK